jgi:hypothetical protein
MSVVSLKDMTVFRSTIPHTTDKHSKVKKLVLISFTFFILSYHHGRMTSSNLEGMIMTNTYTQAEEQLIRKVDEAIDFLHTDRLTNIFLNIDLVVRVGDDLMTAFMKPALESPEQTPEERAQQLYDRGLFIGHYLAWKAKSTTTLDAFKDETEELERVVNMLAMMCESWDIDNGRWVDFEDDSELVLSDQVTAAAVNASAADTERLPRRPLS